jgi:hypothetical protein
MVWQENTRVIVMTTKEIERGKVWINWHIQSVNENIRDQELEESHPQQERMGKAS